jgi:hypothetical protein
MSMKVGSLQLFSAAISALLAFGCHSSYAQQSFTQPRAAPTESVERHPLQGINACRVAATASALRGALWPAILGEESAFAVIAEERANLLRLTGSFSNRSPLLSSIQQNAETLFAQRNVVLKTNQSTRLLRQQSVQALDAAVNVFMAEQSDGAALTRVSAADSLTMLTQRIGKSAAELITIEGISADAVFLLGKDTRSFQELLAAMIDGNAELRIKPVRTSNSRQRLAALEKDRTSMKEQVDAILHDLKNLVSAREAQGKLLVELAALGALSANACSSGENRSGMPPGV